MRVLLTPIGSTGDNLPFIGLGRELARRGHDVAVATSEHFADLVRHSGMRFLPTASETEYRAATEDPDLFDPRKGFAAVMKFVGEYNRRLFDLIIELRGRGPVTVVAHSLDFASRVLSDGMQLPVVRVHLQPSIIRSSYRVPIGRGTVEYSFLPRWLKRSLWSIIDRRILDPAIAPVVNELRARADLQPARRILASQIDSPLLTIALFPGWYAPRQPDWPASLEQCGFPLFDADGAVPAQAEAFLAHGSAPIVFTPGSAMRFGHEFFEAAVGACARLGKRGVLLTRHPEQVPKALPEGTARFDYVPLSAILPRCAALVHHGGIGTTAAGLAAGVPQVIVPFSHDQPDNAHRVLRLGVGRRVPPARLDGFRLARALHALLGSPGVAQHCARVAALCAESDGIVEACDLVESIMRHELGA